MPKALREMVKLPSKVVPLTVTGTVMVCDLPFSVSVPVDYRISHGGKPSPLDGQWRIEFRGPRLAAPWLLDVKDVQDIGVSDLESGELTHGRELEVNGELGSIFASERRRIVVSIPALKEGSYGLSITITQHEGHAGKVIGKKTVMLNVLPFPAQPQP